MRKADYEIPDKQLELFARMMLPEIKKFFGYEEIRIEFEQWQVQQKNNIEKDEK